MVVVSVSATISSVWTYQGVPKTFGHGGLALFEARPPKKSPGCFCGRLWVEFDNLCLGGVFFSNG